jgi:hypothetical protein
VNKIIRALSERNRDFFLNGPREVVACAIFSFENNHNVIFLGKGNT